MLTSRPLRRRPSRAWASCCGSRPTHRSAPAASSPRPPAAPGALGAPAVRFVRRLPRADWRRACRARPSLCSGALAPSRQACVAGQVHRPAPRRRRLCRSRCCPPTRSWTWRRRSRRAPAARAGLRSVQMKPAPALLPPSRRSATSRSAARPHLAACCATASVRAAG
ncbi:hypothetical protein FA09DRAFT_24937 [Tilletiopsis washingtonensis]|uniref:Uncharacterized protein n=1 Tax=Tilletiopsis washingtonensis TaxID=58919 RepID=A0A316ZBK0_9BASI|nr:hypothetical protein FA09DRAFT_24937 [Tilletiopsis washingtonensis]PWN98302.1 hypothetical protein FA09DRAFT_24937 [Tilletiopsis washingtonensis]